MGKFLNKFQKGVVKADEKIQKGIDVKKGKDKFANPKLKKNEESLGDAIYEDYEEDFEEEPTSDYDEVGIQPSQRPESFHHFILENQYKDLERSIRGYKDIYDKKEQKWITIRKKDHCFTDEEAEEILRTAQSHLATDIKLSYINKDVFGAMMMAIYRRLSELFYSIAEYRYGRYTKDMKDEQEAYDKQYEMKLQNLKIFLELWTRIQANYSRAIAGQENRYTHDSVKAQESLQNSGQDNYLNKRYS